ncbi:MAG TPA: aldo/keto reductase [Solirubrobacterales bacterium]|nr:aldo/keto reductase [Solirubrobacterales bacterium]
MAFILAMAMFVLVVDTSLMNVSISALVGDLDTTVSGVQSAIALEALISAAFILISSKVGDLIGRKRAFVLGPVLSENRVLDTWRASERILEEGRARTIGVSSGRIEDLERLEVEADTRPTVHQVELHSCPQRVELRRLHAQYRIVTEAWSPLSQGDLLADETIGEIAVCHGKSPAQTILRWHLQLGNIAIPMSVTAERIRENIEIFDFELSDGEMATISEKAAA